MELNAVPFGGVKFNVISPACSGPLFFTVYCNVTEVVVAGKIPRPTGTSLFISMSAVYC